MYLCECTLHCGRKLSTPDRAQSGSATETSRETGVFDTGGGEVPTRDGERRVRRGGGHSFVARCTVTENMTLQNYRPSANIAPYQDTMYPMHSTPVGYSSAPRRGWDELTCNNKCSAKHRFLSEYRTTVRLLLVVIIMSTP